MAEHPIVFAALCPNGHDPRHQFDVENLMSELVRGTVTFHCTVCGHSWKPNALQKADLQRRLASTLGPAPRH